MRATDFALSVGDARVTARERGAAVAKGRRSANVRELRAWTLPALMRLAADAREAGIERHEIVRRAGLEALNLRDRVEALAGREQELACRLHDCALQLLEYTATDGFGQELSKRQLAELLDRAAEDLGRALDGREAATMDLDVALREVADEAEALGLPPVTLACNTQRAVCSEDVRPIVDAVREALTNVRKHARAQHVTVRVEESGSELRISVADDGVGANAATLADSNGFGLVSSIAGRLGRHGGRSLVQSVPGVGTRVVMAMPVHEVA
jgi:signal transduction histidine kinase